MSRPSNMTLRMSGIGCLLAAMTLFGPGCSHSSGGDAGGSAQVGQDALAEASATPPTPEAGVAEPPMPEAGVDETPMPDAAVAEPPMPEAGVDVTPRPDASIDTRPRPDASIDTTPRPEAGTADAFKPDRTPDTAKPNSDGGLGAAFCPSDGTACKIMPLGDSITDGQSAAGYRVPLFKLALTDNKNITFVGRNANGPKSFSFNGQDVAFPQGHEGYAGYTIQDGGGRSGIYGKVDGAVQTNMPHIILMMIGTNDVDISLDLANAPKRLGELLDKLSTDAPNALIVVAKIVPTRDDDQNTRVRDYNDGIMTSVQTRVGQGRNIMMVDMYKAFTDDANYKTSLMVDKLHPMEAGYAVMARIWYDAIKTYLR